FWNYFGDRQSLLAKLVITYKNGEERIIGTDSDNWKYFDDGPVKYGSLFQGEVYDSRREKLTEGWSTAGYNDVQWEKATETERSENVSQSENKEQDNIPRVDDYSDFNLIGDPGPKVHKIKTLAAESVKEVRP